jgi:hypothetical protein
MAGDIRMREKAVVLPEGKSTRSFGPRSISPVAPGATGALPRPRVVHMYGTRVMVVEDSAEGRALEASVGALRSTAGASTPLAPHEQMGLDAYHLRESPEYQQAKAARPKDGESWDFSPEMRHSCTPPGERSAHEHAAMGIGLANAPTSQRLTGSIAVGIIIVEGPNANLKFSPAERTKVVAEVQNGLSWLATQNPEGLVFKYDIRVAALSVQPGASTLDADQQEALWRDPAMQQLGYATGMAGVSAYVEKLRTNLGTNWTYCVFFTKYPVYHFAYASIGGPRLVMQYDNDGWGPDNIDRVFAHESGHIFGAPDEYASSGCDIGGSWGFYGKPNTNCANGAAGGGVDCIMKGNTWNMCASTPFHLGFPLVQQSYTGVWRQGSDAHYLWVNASWSSFNAKWQELGPQNLRLVDMKITRENGVERYHGVWRQGTGGYYLWVNADQNSFVTKWQQLAAQGLRLVDIEVQNVNGTLLYSGVWLPGTDGYYLWLNADYNSFIAKWQQLAAQNLRLVDFKIVDIGGSQRFFGVWRQGTGGHYLWVNADWNNFVAKWQALAGQGLRLVDIEITQTPQGQRFSGAWLPGTDSYYLWAGADWQHFFPKWQELSAQGLRLVDIDVVPGSGAQSPTPGSLSPGYGGMAEAPADQGEDGMGGGGEAGPGGESGFGAGSISGESLSGAPDATGLPGEGGGSIAAPSSETTSAGFGGGAAPANEAGSTESAPVLVVEGFGGGQLT